jgi:hypothetical protein
MRLLAAQIIFMCLRWNDLEVSRYVCSTSESALFVSTIKSNRTVWISAYIRFLGPYITIFPVRVLQSSFYIPCVKPGKRG